MGNGRFGFCKLLAGGAFAGAAMIVALGAGPALADGAQSPRIQLAHKKPHTAEQLKAFEEVFMEQVRLGDLLFHGDKATEEQMGVKLSTTGMACAMCHPMSADIHPHEFPKFQEQIGKFAVLRDMINWCIEKPNQGERIDPESDAMKALEAYMYWSNRGSVLDPGRH
ncbi:MAG: c-type cytochrome [Kiloniellales bacterium]